MAKLLSSLSSKLLAALGVSAIGYKAYSYTSAESVVKDGYMSRAPSPDDDKSPDIKSKKRDGHPDANKRQIQKAIRGSRSLVERFLAEKSIPGLVIGVSFRGRQVWVKGFGFANVELGTKCKADTVMRIASISKPITMMLLAKLVEEGKLHLDKPIDEYLAADQFPVKTWQGKEARITLRQLVSHLGGIRHYQRTKDASELEEQEYYITTKYKDVFESLNLFKNDDLVAAPGAEFHYTTYGWTLISAVIESVLPPNESFASHLVNKVLRKELGMSNTYVDVNDALIRNRSSCYYKTRTGVLTNCPSVDNSYKIAGGGLLSTIPDLLLFGNVMLYSYRGGDAEGKLKGFLKRETVEEMWSPVPATSKASGSSKFARFFNYGMGWFVLRKEAVACAACAPPPFATLAYHSGAAVGASSAILVLPHEELVVAAFCNLQDVSLADLTFEVAQRFASKLASKATAS